MMARKRVGLLVFLFVAPGCKGSSSPVPDAGAGKSPSDAGSTADAATVDASAPSLDCSSDDPDWPMYGHDVCGTHAGASGGDGGLSTANASKLAVKWTFTAAGDVSATPAVVGGQLYVPDWGGMMNRVDVTTGQAVWSKSVAALAGLAVDGGAPPDPVVSRVTPIMTSNALIFATSRTGFTAAVGLDYMVAVNPDTGALLWSTLLDPHPAAVITGSPVLENGRIYVGVSSIEEVLAQSPAYPCCSFRGSVVALDATTGAVVWTTPMIEDGTYFAPDGGGPAGYAGAAIWSGTPTIDRKRGQIYVTTGNNYAMPTGVDAAAPGDHVESMLALDEATGAIKWSRAMTTDDIWTFGNEEGPDFDFGCGANLFQASVDGGTRDLVGAGQKSGIYWALDAETGALVWKTLVGPGGHLGGIHWGTATDGARIYFGVNDELATAYALGGTGAQAGEMATVGSWGALDPATGAIVWQIANPAMSTPLGGASVNGPLTVVGGVVLAGSMDTQGTMYALEGTTGEVLWSFASGGTVYGGAAVAGGVVYWGSGYPASRLGFGTESNKLYAFAVGP
jgi:polyvinyl alcohol dehydrogenase (cytochrome)